MKKKANRPIQIGVQLSKEEKRKLDYIISVLQIKTMSSFFRTMIEIAYSNLKSQEEGEATEGFDDDY